MGKMEEMGAFLSNKAITRNQNHKENGNEDS
jgi:hypothetical protein